MEQGGNPPPASASDGGAAGATMENATANATGMENMTGIPEEVVYTWWSYVTPFFPLAFLIIIVYANYRAYKFLFKKKEEPDYLEDYAGAFDNGRGRPQLTSEQLAKRKELYEQRQKQSLLYRAIQEKDTKGLHTFGDEILDVRFMETEARFMKPEGKTYSVTPILHTIALIKQGTIDCLEILLERGQDPNEAGHFCNKMVARPLTALAALQKIPPETCQKACQMLIDYGADMNAEPTVKGTLVVFHDTLASISSPVPSSWIYGYPLYLVQR